MSVHFTFSSHLYEIQEVLGESPFSTVYLAQRSDKDFKIKQSVVIKLFKEKKSSLPALHIESLLRARHSFHLVKILSFEKIQSQPALILEYIPGINLKQLTEKRELNSDEINCICSQILKGLEELKNTGLAHGDLSLSNILIDTSGQVYLTDYGLGNYEKNVYGTTPFTAPELHEGKKSCFSSDLFSLGVLEKILKGSFTDKELSYMNSKDFICQNNLLLDPSPQKRKKRNFIFSTNARLSLGEKVQQILFIKNHLKQKPKHHINKKQNRFPYRLVCLGGTLLVLLFTANPFVSYGKYQPSHQPGEVLIRSLKWIHIQMAGVTGYTPINIPIHKSGTYKIKWKKNNRTGVKYIYLKSGQKIVLRDNDFP